jgi:rhomboid protease GluP
MDLNYVLLWITGFTAVSSLFRALRAGGPGSSGGKFISALLLAVVAAGILLFPNIAGYVAGAFWCAFFLGPGLAMRRLNRMVAAEEYGRAASISRWLGFIYPFYDWRAMSRIYTALDLAKSGSLDAATEILEQFRHSKSPRARSAIAQLYRLQGRWKDFLDWTNENLSPAEVDADPNLSLLRLRAWGELGQSDHLLAGFEAFDRRYHNIASYRDAARLYLVAFFGKPDMVAKLYDGPFRYHSQARRELWLASAQARRLNPPPETEQAAALFARLDSELAHEFRYNPAPAASNTRPILTYALVAINVLMFGVETLAGGSTSDAVLIRLGALLPAEMTAADSWRLLAASFLHIGLLHITMNMLALFFLGPFVERILRGWRYAACYLGAGIGSMATVVVMYRLGVVHYGLVAGASGSIMGLVGATAAICLRDSRILKTRASVDRLRNSASIIVLQFFFDAATPQVSMTAHLGGAAFGFLLALLLGSGQ